MRHLFKTTLVLSLITACDPASEPAVESDTAASALEGASALSVDDVEPQAGDADLRDESDSTFSPEDGERLWLLRSLYRRHLAGYPGGPSPSELRFVDVLTEDGALSPDYLERFSAQVEAELGAGYLDSDIDQPLRSDALSQILGDGEAQDYIGSEDLAAPAKPMFGGAAKYRIKFESVRSVHCGIDTNGEKPCAIEEPMVAWCAFWPSGSMCGFTDYTSAKNGEERLLAGVTALVTGTDPSKIVLFHQVIEIDGTFNAAGYTSALATAKALIQPAMNWTKPDPAALAKYWNAALKNADADQDDDLSPLHTQVWTLANFQTGTAPNGKFLSDCAYSKLPSACHGSYSHQWMGYFDDNPKAWRVALSISALF